MQSKRYDGYKSFQYLEPGLDYKPFKLAKELNRVPSRRVELSPEQEERVRRIFQEHPIISLHDHCFIAPENLSEFFEFRRQGRDWTGYEGLSVSGLDCVFDNLMNGTAMITSRGGWKWDDIIYDLGMRLSDIAHQDMVVLATRTEDILRAKQNGQIAFVVSLEGAAMIENELDRLDILYGLGVRCLGIAYSEGNQLGGGLREPNDGGLTVFGRKAVQRMNKLGIAIDISHSGDRTSMDTIEVSEKPVFITHAGARALWNSNRLKPDEVIQACAAKGGVIGIEAAPHTTITRKTPRHSIESFMEHFEYCVNLVGIDHVAFGPDVLFGDHVGLHHTLSEALSIAASRGTLEYPQVEWVDGLESPAEAFPNIVRWLVKHGYSDSDIAKVVGGNILRVLQEVWYK
ncbi:dipeptidase [Meiothermus granaticius]|uniref:Membrane dipeptidase (Peptidase family M19) n=1 Tax=Meiothermus granaticius NBRC 107808 TaxID=1227551 RepID=A0A399FBQ4_9DEIN|nr:membrane dipeptidase [Meiothermus granaticius]MCL6527996.1 dipeptidase [Thermaceae bacterium]RIH93116.1 Membrane dipeptidase (Peptidase family M19) [Meiothermus granaticius NBRC 107808]GEM88007.1 peptidase [Meiothermus granaticius NBRC 107808]